LKVCILIPVAGCSTHSKSFSAMPIYAYKCESCGHAKDVLQKLSDPLLTDCPQCGAPTFKKQLTAAGFQLKGSGWYVTDFRGGDSGAPAKDAVAPAAASDGAASSSAPAAKADSPSAAPAPSAPAASTSSSTGKAD
jgi:putative FmdB family regulatory protein